MIFGRKKKDESFSVQTAPRNAGGLLSAIGSSGSDSVQRQLYKTLRESVPIIDAAVCKLVRLTGSFKICCEDKEAENNINDFLRNIRVNSCGVGIENFLGIYLEQLLTYGTAVGEIVPDRSGKNIAALYNASLDDVELSAEDNPLELIVYSYSQGGERIPVKYPALVMCSTIMNEPGEIYGTSILKGLPFVGDILLKIFQATETNWDRIGNVRFAVSYKPGEGDRSFSKERARQIASEWSKAMQSSEPRDFVSVGDVSIKVIGADNQIPDSQVPVRQLLEQIVAKLSIPPFLLGLSWSSTERMSSQQADILTSELEYYRKCLDGCIRRICDIYFKLGGEICDYEIVWNNINLQDEVELARAKLLNAQAASLEKSIDGKE